VGSFPIPIQTIATAASVQVVLSNTAAVSVTLSIPLDYRNCTTVTLTPSGCRVFGVFTKPSGARNVGFRDVTPTLPPIAAPRLALTPSGTNILLAWPSENSLQ
jgi:hypothetical protein